MFLVTAVLLNVMFHFYHIFVHSLVSRCRNLASEVAIIGLREIREGQIDTKLTIYVDKIRGSVMGNIIILNVAY